MATMIERLDITGIAQHTIALVLIAAELTLLEALAWLASNLAFSFFIGVFFGVFSIDVAYSINLVTRIRQ